MKSKEKQRVFFKDYSTVVPFLEKVFYYGSFSSADFEEMDMMKKSKYSYYKRIFEYAFGDLLFERKNIKGKKALGLRIDHFYDPHRIFLRFFALKSYVSNARMVQICFILQHLSNGGCYKVRNIVDAASVFSDASYINEVSMRRLLDDMAEKGIIEKSDNGYRIVDIGLNKTAAVDEIMPLVDLCTNIYPLSICGGHISSKLKKDYVSPFLFKHRHLGLLFNDETIWKLTACIYEKKTVLIKYADKQFRSLLPYKIITDEFSGRQYVFALNLGNEYVHDMLLRIDRIKSVEINSASCELPDDTELESRFRKALEYSFTGTTVPFGKEPDTGTLVFLSTAENEVRKRFPYADVEKTDDGHMKCRIAVNNMSELKPWLRVNMGRIKLTESSDDTVNELEHELEDWRKMYGIV